VFDCFLRPYFFLYRKGGEGETVQKRREARGGREGKGNPRWREDPEEGWQHVKRLLVIWVRRIKKNR
jgi:hypothetical protein